MPLLPLFLAQSEDRRPGYANDSVAIRIIPTKLPQPCFRLAISWCALKSHPCDGGSRPVTANGSR